LNPSDKDLLLELSALNFFSLYEPEKALAQVKQCLHSDPEDRACKKQFRLIKSIEKEIQKALTAKEQQRFATALNGLIGTSNKPGIQNDIDAPYEKLKLDLNVSELPKKLHLKIFSLACELSAIQKDMEKAETWCSATLELDDNNQEALKQLGEMKLNANEFEEAVRYLDKAFESSGKQDHQIRQLLVRAQQLLKQSKKRDYYKILGNIPLINFITATNNNFRYFKRC
jgi:DnaJ family protein C protein 3